MNRIGGLLASMGDAIGAALLAAISFFPTRSTAMLLVVVGLGVAIVLGGKVVSWWLASRSEVHLRNLREMTGPDVSLQRLGEEMGLPSPWRISLYTTVPDDETASWHRVARASNVQMYQQGGREVIPSGEGVLAMAEFNGTGDELWDVPAKAEDPDGFLHFHGSRNVSPAVAEAFRMPSSSYASVVFRVPAVETSRGYVSIGLVAETASRERLLLRSVQGFATQTLLESVYRSSVLDGVLEDAKIMYVDAA